MLTNWMFDLSSIQNQKAQNIYPPKIGYNPSINRHFITLSSYNFTKEI